VTLKEDGSPSSYTGPQGETWDLYDYESLFIYEVKIYAAEAFTGKFDFNN